ncbi:MAG: SDR family oxidoreductase [Thermoanaerobaculaceae bacterium]|jgi:pteridine reductase|nr:SDR family oxidoreductase [Thermoanaerobaculaceae bacterium]
MSGAARVALVTGGAVRVGRAIVTHLATRGWAVAFTYRGSATQARELADELGATGHACLPVPADLDRIGDCRTLVDTTLDRFGRLDALVNNASVFPRTPLADLDEAAFLAVLQTNLVAPVMLARLTAAALGATTGSIVNLVDILAERPIRHHLAYIVSKAGLVAATRALAVELAPSVRVNAIAPGIALFPDSYDEATRQRLTARTLLGRAGTPLEIARAVEYLLDGASTMTGQVLTLDAGRTVPL